MIKITWKNMGIKVGDKTLKEKGSVEFEIIII